MALSAPAWEQEVPFVGVDASNQPDPEIRAPHGVGASWSVQRHATRRQQKKRLKNK